MSETRDIIAAIDFATGCQRCGKDLARSVSDDFCSEQCQQAWQAEHVAGIRGVGREVTFVFEADTSGLDAAFASATAALERIHARYDTGRYTVAPTPPPLAHYTVDADGTLRQNVPTGTLSVPAGTQLFRSDGEAWEPFGTIATDITFEEHR